MRLPVELALSAFQETVYGSEYKDQHFTHNLPAADWVINPEFQSWNVPVLYYMISWNKDIFLFKHLRKQKMMQICPFLCAKIEENLGMAMIFAIVSAAQEFLNERIDDIKAAREERKNRAEEEKKKEEEEAVSFGLFSCNRLVVLVPTTFLLMGIAAWIGGRGVAVAPPPP